MEENLWVRIYPRVNKMKPVMISGISLASIITSLTSINGQSPVQGFAWDSYLKLSLAEMERLVSCIHKNEREQVKALVAGIKNMAVDKMTDEQSSDPGECLIGFRIDLLSAEGNIAAGGVVSTEQRYTYVPTGMIRRSHLKALKHFTGLDMTRPGELSLKTMHRKIGWLAGNECPDLLDENGNDLSSDLRMITGPLYIHGHSGTRLDWF
jgi:hypothetical protein